MADEQRIATAQANGQSTAIEISRHTHIIESHLRTLFVFGTFDSATVIYQISPDNVLWFNVANADSITVATAINVEHRGKFHRISVSGGVSVEAIDAIVM